MCSTTLNKWAPRWQTVATEDKIENDLQVAAGVADAFEDIDIQLKQWLAEKILKGNH